MNHQESSYEEKAMFIRICNNCKVLRAVGSERVDMLIWKKKSCPLCGSGTTRFELPKKSKKKGDKTEKKVSRTDAIIEMITDRCRDFDCPGSITASVKGPVVTEYEFTPDRFTRVKKLKTLDEDLAIALSVDTVTIRRIPGRPCIGISIPNADREQIVFDDCIKNVEVHAKDMALPINFGITYDGKPYVEDLAEYPHLLIGGATGTGKSVLLNQILTNLLHVRAPEELQLIMIDPKTVELFPYKGIPHLIQDPVSDVWKSISVLEEVVKTMKNRTEILHKRHVNNIKEMNAHYTKLADQAEKAGSAELAEEYRKNRWPYILVVIDEFADIVLQEKKEFIMRMAQISAMARAAGISVIAATQRPSVDVLPGKVKVNFLARAALKVPSVRDSQTVLNYKGAETLLGKGDMFILSPDKSGLQRVHVPLCTREDRTKIIAKIMQKHSDICSMPLASTMMN